MTVIISASICCATVVLMVQWQGLWDQDSYLGCCVFNPSDSISASVAWEIICLTGMSHGLKKGNICKLVANSEYSTDGTVREVRITVVCKLLLVSGETLGL